MARVKPIHCFASMYLPRLCPAVRPRAGLPAFPLLLLALALGAVCPAVALEYPGPRPGRPQFRVNADTIRFENRALSLTWVLKDGGLVPGTLRDATTGSNVPLDGEVFVITLRDGSRYPASVLRLDGPPRVTRLAGERGSSRLAERLPGRQVQATLRSSDRRLAVVWRAIAREDANYVRQELELTATTPDFALDTISWLEARFPEPRTVGRVDGSPVVAGPFFLGAEDPMGLNQVSAENRVTCRVRWNAPLHPGERLTPSLVLGVTPPGQLRRGFLHYLERERAHPYRPFLHYNSWYDIAWHPFALNETNCLEAIRLVGERFLQPHHVVMDALVFDDGWDDPRTLWQFHAGFPRGFAPLAELARQYGTRLGVWLSPFGGYGEPREQRLAFGRAQGYETNPTGFSLAGPKYYAAFRDACVRQIREYRVNHFKFDGIATGMYADGGAEYVRDTEAMRRLMLELRREDPDLYINLTTGSWPSPFWLRYADSVWRQGGDMGLAGKGPTQQQWLTYRDQEVHRNVVGKGPLYPLNALMTQGVAYSRHGSAGDPTFNSAGFKDDVRAFFGSGTGLQELYIQPDKLTAADWQVLAEAARWARTHAEVLVDTHWIGGDPARLEVYGYASWSPRRGVVMLRNPDDQPQDITLELHTAFELPPGAPECYRVASPWAEDVNKAAETVEATTPWRVRLAPFEVRVLEAVPVKQSAR